MDCTRRRHPPVEEHPLLAYNDVIPEILSFGGYFSTLDASYAAAAATNHHPLPGRKAHSLAP